MSIDPAKVREFLAKIQVVTGSRKMELHLSSKAVFDFVTAAFGETSPEAIAWHGVMSKDIAIQVGAQAADAAWDDWRDSLATKKK